MFASNENPIVPFESENAKRLADLASVYQDLGFAAECLGRLRGTAEEDRILARSLWTAALIAYARCFASGKRWGLETSMVDTLGQGALQLHEYILNQRSKHIAHSVNPFEQTRVGAVLAAEITGQRQVVGIATLSMSLFKPHVDELEVAERFVRDLLSLVARQCREVTDVVRLEATRANLDDLYARERLQLRAPDLEMASRARD